ncbi:glycerol-3-phosphate cytidylyltransferase [Virgibacillus sp. CBA3643]|uniref:glycerol-3-phosphate cytidylyltransferase n=1 Tax=Virgibacillus sp. CBA3643 TaxID=2942278 RepID=UPI0035A2B13D
MKKIITYGTFDLIHSGHIHILRRAKKMGDYLIVGLSTDEFNMKKDKETYYSYDDRKLIMEAIRYVDMVIPEKTWDQKITDIKEHETDIFVMGDDWRGEFDFLNDYCDVVYLPRTRGISSTHVKNNMIHLRDDLH